MYTSGSRIHACNQEVEQVVPIGETGYGRVGRSGEGRVEDPEGIRRL